MRGYERLVRQTSGDLLDVEGLVQSRSKLLRIDEKARTSVC
jgi:hypothetical protein